MEAPLRSSPDSLYNCYYCWPTGFLSGFVIIFEIIDRLGRKIRLTKERSIHIIERSEMAGQEERIRETLVNPDLIKGSVSDNSVLIYYRHYLDTPVTEKYLVVIEKVFNTEGVILTSYFTDRIKEGATIWKRK